jgi:hypothetical protein
MQVNAHKGFEYVFQHTGPMKAPWQLKAATRIPGIQHVVGRLVGIGVRPEHIRTPAARASLLKRIAVGTGVAAAIAVNLARILRR